MRRFRKHLAFVGACALALFLTIQHRGEDIRVGAYAPLAAASGTLALGYTYVNDAGLTRTGSIDIPYQATTDNTVTGTASPPALSVTSGTSNPVTVSFAPGDGNPATGLNITSGLSPLPAGWNAGSGTFACATVSASSGCQL